MHYLVAMLAGLLFGTGLLISGMADPQIVIGFLDLSRLLDGSWNPALMMVMMGALAVYLPVYVWLVRPRLEKQQAPLLASRFCLPRSAAIDRRLVLGAGLFGVGWGVIGICPGPGLVGAGQGSTPMLLFTACFVTGLLAARRFRQSEPQQAG